MTKSNKQNSDILRDLFNRDWSFPSESGGNGLFGLHPYPAKYIPQIPRSIIKDVGVAKGGIIFDPFCGSGTSLIEAQQMGYSSIGIDLNPIACLISKVATTPQPNGLAASINRCLQFSKTILSPSIAQIPNLDHWFKRSIQKAIASILEAIENEICEHTRDILRLALSSTLVRVSNQDSDTRYAAVEKKMSANNVFELFHKCCLKYLKTLPPHSSKLPIANIICSDILKVKKDIIGQPVGLVICSPPYPNAYEYWLYHKYRMWWLGYDPIYVKKHEIGARPNYFKKNPQTPEDFRNQMSQVFCLLKETCINESYACFVIGDSKIHGEIINTSELLIDAANDFYFDTIAVINRDIAQSRKSFNLSNSRLKEENLILFKKRTKRKNTISTKVDLKLHPYKYYPYEQTLAYREIASIPNINRIVTSEQKISISVPNKDIHNLNKLVYVNNYKADGESDSKQTIQANIENNLKLNGSKNRQSTRYGAHGLHEYKGKFNPQVVRSLLNIYQVKPGGIILDPFCGSGTTLIEASIAGIESIGWDMNPFAVYLSNAKISALHTPPETLENLAKRILSQIDKKNNPDDKHRASTNYAYLKKWFPKKTLDELEKFRAIILSAAKRNSAFFLIILSDLLRDYSLQEPSDLRIRRRKSPFPQISLREKYEIEIKKKISKLAAGFAVYGTPNTTSKAFVVDGREMRNIITSSLTDSSIDFALTSPPYATALPYIDTQRLSLIWLELLCPESLRATEATLIGSREAKKTVLKSLQNDFSKNTAKLPFDVIEYCRLLQNHISENDGFRRKAVPLLLYRYFSDMLKSFFTMLNVIKSKGIYLLIVGTNRTTLGGTLFQIDTPRLLANLAEHAGWYIIELLPLETYKRYGIHAANAVQGETLIVLEKP